MQYSQEQLITARDKMESWLAQQPGFNGSGIGMAPGGNLVIKIYSNQMPAATRNAIVAKAGELPIQIEETGEFRAQIG
jgi:hypothetical protein